MIQFKRYLTCAVLLTITSFAQAGVEYNELQIKDFDEMNQLVQVKIRDANNILKADKTGSDEEADEKAIEILRTTLKIIFSRPNKDNLVSKLVPDLRKNLKNLDAYEDSVSQIANEAINGLEQKLPIARKGTYLFVLENIMSEIKPEAVNNEALKKVIIRIRDANIQIPREVEKDRKFRSMYKSVSPSKIAEKILKSLPEKKEADL